MDAATFWALVQQAWPVMLRGTGYTLGFAVSAMVLGLALAGLIAAVRVFELPLLRSLATIYVSAFRGTPLLVQVFVIYYGLPSVGIEFSPVTAGILALTLNVAAYLSESLRGAIGGVGQGQWMAASSLGLTRLQALRHIVGPQALRVATPSLANSLISLVKDTSLVSVIAVSELMLGTKELIATTFRPFPLYLAAAVIYWCLSLVFERVQRVVERRLAYPH